MTLHFGNLFFLKIVVQTLEKIREKYMNTQPDLIIGALDLFTEFRQNSCTLLWNEMNEQKL